jgi:hypothetical protein
MDRERVHCIIQINEAYNAEVVECFDDYEEASKKRDEYEVALWNAFCDMYDDDEDKEYSQKYYIDQVWFYKKGDKK